jgi:hypothetical protein
LPRGASLIGRVAYFCGLMNAAVATPVWGEVSATGMRIPTANPRYAYPASLATRAVYILGANGQRLEMRTPPPPLLGPIRSKRDAVAPQSATKTTRPAPAEGRGRLQKAIARAFILSHVQSTTTILDWCYPRLRGKRRSLTRPMYWSVKRILLATCVRVGRGAGYGRPFLWRRTKTQPVVPLDNSDDNSNS